VPAPTNLRAEKKPSPTVPARSPARNPRLRLHSRSRSKPPLRPAGGQPLDTGLRTVFEPLLGRDFSDVRVHVDGSAGDQARRLRAQAFVVGSDIFFAPGRFAPATPHGRWLLAHELAHVAQPQEHEPSSTAGERTRAACPATSAVEVEARGVANQLALGRPARVTRARRAGATNRFGEPENVPELTYISTQGEQVFLQQALEYHTLWGLAPRRVSSVEAILGDLARGQGRLARVRIVMHATEKGILSSLFASEPPRFSVEKDRLSAWAQSDVAGLAADLGDPFPLGPDLPNSIVAALRRRNAGLLAPFGLEQSGGASGALAELVDRTAQRFLLLASRTRRNAPDVDTLTASTDLLLAAIRARVAQQAQGRISAAQTQTLQNELEASARAVGLHPRAPVTFDATQVARLRQANRAVAAGFRGTLGGARRRFDANSWIDIRGCNAGRDLDYLRAFSQFFGQAPALPHVSAPDWFQTFPRLGFQELARADEVPSHVDTVAFGAALEHWIQVTGAARSRQALITFYRYEIARRAQPTDLRVQGVGAGSSSPSGAPPALTLPQLPGPPSTLPMPAADVALVSILSAPDRHPPLTLPSLLPASDRRSARLGPSRKLTDPFVNMAQQALGRLSAPRAEARFYFESALVLPVQSGSDLRLHVLQSLRGAAMRSWVLSQWATAAPGLQAVLKAPRIADQLRVQALVESHDLDAQMVFPPDPRYWEHIKSI
jgi:hypothetical protein